MKSLCPLQPSGLEKGFPTHHTAGRQMVWRCRDHLTPAKAEKKKKNRKGWAIPLVCLQKEIKLRIFYFFYLLRFADELKLSRESCGHFNTDMLHKVRVAERQFSGAERPWLETNSRHHGSTAAVLVQYRAVRFISLDHHNHHIWPAHYSIKKLLNFLFIIFLQYCVRQIQIQFTHEPHTVFTRVPVTILPL